MNSETAVAADSLQLAPERSHSGMMNPVDLQSSAAIIIDDDDDEGDDALARDESYADVNAMIMDNESNGQQQPSFLAGSEARASDRLLNAGSMYVPGQLEPLEAVPEDGESQAQDGWGQTNASESVVQFNPRFSSIMSERDNQGLNFNKEKAADAAFIVPRSFSHINPDTNQD